MNKRMLAALAALVVGLAMLPVGGAMAQQPPPDAEPTPVRAVVPTMVPSAVVPVVPTVAPGYGAPHVAPTSANIIGVTQQPFVGISLQDAIGMALLKNPNLAVSASNFVVARYQVTQAKAPFDVRLQMEPTSNFSVQPPVNLFAAGPGDWGCYPSTGLGGGTVCTPGPGNVIQHQSGFQYGLGGQTISGGTYSVGIQQTRTFNNTIFNEYNPYYLASLNATVSQPLLRNMGMSAAKRQLKLAIVNSDSQAQQSLIDTSNTISQVEDAYWSLVAAWRNVAIQEEALKDAIAQQHSNVRLARHGAAAPIDAVESSTQVATFQDQVFSALQQVSEIQNQLKGLIVTQADDPIWSANLVPTTSVLQVPSAPSLSDVMAIALKNRPEIAQALDRQRQADIDRAYAHSQALPQADLQATYQSNGFAGYLNPVPPIVASSCAASSLPACPTPPPYTIGGMPNAYQNLWSFRYPVFNIGFLVSFPIENSFAMGLKGQAEQEQHQAQILATSVVTRISFEARNALQNYESALSRLDAARTAREAADQVLASEQRKFKNGESTTFLVLQRQVELNQARGRELLAQTDLNKSIVEIQRVEGTILSANNVDLNKLGTQALSSPSPSSQH